MTTFSVLVPTWQRPEHLRNCLESLAVQARKPDEILISLRAEDTEGISTAADFLSAHPELKVVQISVSEPGVIPAERALLAAAAKDVVCFLDDDARARPRWLQRLAFHYDVDPRVGGVAGPALDAGPGVGRPRMARFRNRVFFPGLILDQSTRRTERTLRVDHFRGANMSFRRQALLDCGGFDARLSGDGFRFELDACLRMTRAGWRLLFDPEAEVDHFEAPRSDGPRRAAKIARRNAAHETYVFLKHWGLGPAGCLHLFWALLVGNFPCPGILWGIGGALGLLVSRNRHLPRPWMLLPAMRGRLDGVAMALANRRNNLVPTQRQDQS